MTKLLVIKTGALGDVLRTTSILPGLAAKHAGLSVSWVTAPGAADLVLHHRLVERVLTVDPKDTELVARLARELSEEPWDWLLSLDDEQPLCALARDVPAAKLSGALLDGAGRRVYTPDVGPWFDMGLLSVHGKARADELKLENQRSHPEIFAAMFAVEMGSPELPLPPAAEAFGDAFARRHRLFERGPVIGLNTGAGGRWRSKTLPVERTVRLVQALDRALGGRVTFLVLGGRDERERNDAILAELGPQIAAVDAGTDNPLLDFAALVDRCDLLITSDSLALHVGVAREVPIVAFFAPTSAAEIELYGRGEKVVSTAADYCSYAPDADTSSLTVERLVAAGLRQLARAASLQ